MADALNTWLRRVRPPTGADADDWAAGDEAQAMLAAVHERAAGSSSRNRRNWPRIRLSVALPTAAIAVAAVAVLIVSTATSSTTSRPKRHTPVVALPGLRPAAKLLEPFQSCDSLLSALRKHAEQSVGPYGFSPYPFYVGYGGYGAPLGAGRLVNGPAATADSLSQAAKTPSSYAQFSSTNTQEVGVDEPDVVKIVGTKVLTVTDGKLRVLDAKHRKVLSTLDLTLYEGWQTAQLMVSGTKAVVVFGGDVGAYSYQRFPNFYGYYGYAVPAGFASTMVFVDFAGAAKVTGTLRTSGGYLDARMVGSTMRVVMNSAPDINFPAARGYANTAAKKRAQTLANQAVIRSAPLSSWLPSYTLSTGTSTTTKSVPCDMVSRPSNYTGSSIVTTYTLDLGKLGSDPDPAALVADGDTVYASQTDLYVSSNATCAFCDATKPQPTEIHRFDISGTGAPVYLGTATIGGRLLSAYSMSEYNGSLRVAVTNGNAAKAQTNRIYVLDAETLTQTGLITILARGEQIYAVRFMADRGYVITYRQTDPLYVLDLSDPAAPRVAGTLKVNGYATYLHDAGNGRLIGVGQAVRGKFRQPAGLQVSVFDVHKPSAPRVLQQVVEPKTPSYGAVDPHAFLYYAETGLLVVPVQQWSSSESGKALVLKLQGTKLERFGLISNPIGPSAADDGAGIQRSMIVGGALWTVSGGGVLVTMPSNTLHRIAWIPFG